jgi:hypothetical protein
MDEQERSIFQVGDELWQKRGRSKRPRRLQPAVVQKRTKSRIGKYDISGTDRGRNISQDRMKSPETVLYPS